MAMNVCLGIIVWFLLPETKQVPLEEMDGLFGGVSHVERGAAIIMDNKLHDIETQPGVVEAEKRNDVSATVASNEPQNKV